MERRGIAQQAYREVVQMARRFARSEDEALDLAQDALEIALDRGFEDWSSSARRPWLHGVLRKRAAFIARSEGRRRRREQLQPATAADAEPTGWVWQPEFLASLPSSLRAVATLVNGDFCAAEIRWLLELSDAALRTRLSALRRAVRAQAEAPVLTTSKLPAALGPRRRPLLTSLKQLGGRAVATHDPDGHSIVVKMVAHKNGRLGNRG